MKVIQRDLSSPSAAKRYRASRFDVYEGAGSPEGVVTAKQGDVYHRLDGSANTSFYVKGTASGNTGWYAPGGAGGWQNEEIFLATQGQTVFTITGFTFTALDKLSVYINGAEQDEGVGYDYTRNAGLGTITLTKAVTSSARVKVRKW